MATQNALTSTGRNRGGRRGSNQPNPDALNIGSGMSVKDVPPAVHITQQVLAKDAPAQITLTRKTLDEAAKIIGGFHKANDVLVGLKEQAELQRGGLSDIVFRLCKLGAAEAPKPDMRWAAAAKVLQSAEAYERQRWQKQQKLPELPTARAALGASWQTYKSQLLRCLEKGLNPEDFTNGNAFREAGNNTGNRTRRSARTTSAATAGAGTIAGVLEQANMRVELSAAIADLVKKLQALTEEQQMDFANRVHRLTTAAAKLTLGQQAPEEGAQTEGATGTM